VEAALVKVDGYKTMKADVKKQEVAVTFDPVKTNPQALAKAITENTDFRASVP
jgi:copper chaperone CopZ